MFKTISTEIELPNRGTYINPNGDKISIKSLQHLSDSELNAIDLGRVVCAEYDPTKFIAESHTDVFEEGVWNRSYTLIAIEPIPEDVQIKRDLADSDSKLIAMCARQFEDMIQDRIDAGKFVPQRVSHEIAYRVGKRARLAELQE